MKKNCQSCEHFAYLKNKGACNVLDYWISTEADSSCVDFKTKKEQSDEKT